MPPSRICPATCRWSPRATSSAWSPTAKNRPSPPCAHCACNGGPCRPRPTCATWPARSVRTRRSAARWWTRATWTPPSRTRAPPRCWSAATSGPTRCTPPSAPPAPSPTSRAGGSPCGPARRTRTCCAPTWTGCCGWARTASTSCAWRPRAAMAATAPTMSARMPPCCPWPWARRCACSSRESRSTSGSPRARASSWTCARPSARAENCWPATSPCATPPTTRPCWPCCSPAACRASRARWRWATAPPCRPTAMRAAASPATTWHRWCAPRGCAACRPCPIPSPTTA